MSLATCGTVPGIQLREYRADVNGAKAGLHGGVRVSLAQSPPRTAGLYADGLLRRRTWRKATAAQRTQYSLKRKRSRHWPEEFGGQVAVSSLFVVPKLFEIDPNSSLE